MSSANKAKGTRWETAVKRFFEDRRLKAFRPAQAGRDVGDVHVAGLVCVQAKDVAGSRYSEWITDVREQAEHAGLPFGVVVHKRRQRGVGDAYVVMDLDTFTSLLSRLELAEQFIATTPYVHAHYNNALTREGTL